MTKAITIADEVAAGRVLRLAGQHPSRTPGALFAIKAGPACCGRGLTLRDTSGLTFHPEPRFGAHDGSSLVAGRGHPIR